MRLRAHINAIIDAAALAYVSEHLADERRAVVRDVAAGPYRCTSCPWRGSMANARAHAQTHGGAEFERVPR